MYTKFIQVLKFKIFLYAFCLFFMCFIEEHLRCQLLKSFAFMKKINESEKCGINVIKNNKSFFLYQNLKNLKTQIDIWIISDCVLNSTREFKQ